MTGIPAGLAAIIAETSQYAPVEGPNEDYPGGPFTLPDIRARYLLAALAGVELGYYDRRIIGWLTQWDDYTARLVVSLLVRARRAGYADATRGAPILPPPRIDSELWTCRGCGGQMIGRRPADDRCRRCAG